MTETLVRRCWEDALRACRIDQPLERWFRQFPTIQPDRILCLGKAAGAMADAIAPMVDGHVPVLVVSPQDRPDGASPRWRWEHASHPVPDSSSLAAGQAALDFAREARSGLIVLVSGGTSSLLCAPVDGLSLTTKQEVHLELLRSGLGIREINTVRRHLSRVKGGGLLQAASCPVVCGIMSDVVGGEPHDVGSGPAVPDPTTRGQALQILAQSLPHRVASLAPLLVETVKQQGTLAYEPLLMKPLDLAVAFADALRRPRLHVTVESRESISALALSQQLVQYANELKPGEARVLSCEPTLSLSGTIGRGGRAGWVALRCLHELPVDVVLLAGASDGLDGNSDGGGACVSGRMSQRVSRTLAARALASFSDAEVHRSLGSPIPSRVTGLNLTDVYAVVHP